MIGNEVSQIVCLGSSAVFNDAQPPLGEPSLRVEFALASPAAHKRPHLAMDRRNNKTVPTEGVFAQRNTVRLRRQYRIAGRCISPFPDKESRCARRLSARIVVRK